MDVDVKKIHEIVLDVYKEFKKVCEENNIRFFAISGTTLGAVLWNGIIPWDDDIDIAVPAEDYEKLIKLYKKGAFSDNISFNEYIWFGGKLYNNKTTVTNVYYLDDPNRYNGVSIDIVPLINIPDKKNEQKAFVEDLTNFYYSGILYDRYKILDGVKSKKELMEWQKKLLHSYRFGETKHVMDFSDRRYILSASGFNEPKIVKFEDTTIPISSNYEEDLRIQYGKYQKYPPESVRRNFHLDWSIIDLQKPISYYQNNLAEASDDCKKIISMLHKYEGFVVQDNLRKERYIKSLETYYEQLKNDYEALKKNKGIFTKIFAKVARKLKKLLKRPA